MLHWFIDLSMFNVRILALGMSFTPHISYSTSGILYASDIITLLPGLRRNFREICLKVVYWFFIWKFHTYYYITFKKTPLCLLQSVTLGNSPRLKFCLHTSGIFLISAICIVKTLVKYLLNPVLNKN